MSGRFENASVFMVAGLLLVVGMLVTDTFLTGENILNILRAVALLGIVASGMAFVTYSGNMADLSVPSIMAFSGIITVAALSWGIIPALCAGILAGMAVGVVNGIVVGRLNANPILWTLAVSFFMEGLMRFVWSNNQVYPDLAPGSPGEAFTNIYRGSIGPIPVVVLVMLLMFAAGYIVMTRTRFGIEAKLVGSSRNAARNTGTNVPSVVLLAFVTASFAASVGGIFITSLNKLGVFYLGQGYDFRAVTAVVIGGTMLSGGKGHMAGVFGGVMVIGLLTNIMTHLGFTMFEQNIVTGTVFILVVGIHQYRLRKYGRDYA
jgi:ribose/xylose/arabinose/galactoside ABC-type transport system permease subunit